MMRFPTKVEIDGDTYMVTSAEYRETQHYSGAGPIQREIRLTLVHYWSPQSDKLPDGWQELVVAECE